MTSAAECATAPATAPEVRPLWEVLQDADCGVLPALRKMPDESQTPPYSLGFRFDQEWLASTGLSKLVCRLPANLQTPDTKRPVWNKVSTSSALVFFVQRAFDPERRLPFNPDIYWNDAQYVPDRQHVSKGLQSYSDSTERFAGSKCAEATKAGLKSAEEWWKKFRQTATYNVDVPIDFVGSLRSVVYLRKYDSSVAARTRTLLSERVPVFRYKLPPLWKGSPVITYPSSLGGGILSCVVQDCPSTIQTTVASAFELHGVPYRLPTYTCVRHEKSLRQFNVRLWKRVLRKYARDARSEALQQLGAPEQLARDSRTGATWDTEDTKNLEQSDVTVTAVNEPPAKIQALMAKNYCTSGPNRIFADRRVYSEQNNTPLWTEPSSSPDYRFIINEDDDPEARPASLVYGDEPGRVREIDIVPGDNWNVDHTLPKKYDVSRFTFAEPKRPFEVLPSDPMFLIASEMNPLYNGRKDWSLIPAKEAKNERIDSLKTLKDKYKLQLTHEQKVLFIEEARHQYYLGEIDMQHFGAFYCMTFEDTETKELAKKQDMTPETLRKDWRRFMETILNPVELDSEEESAKVIGKLTLDQIREINHDIDEDGKDSGGGLIAIRWTGGRNVQIMDTAAIDSNYKHYFDAGEFDGWLPCFLEPGSDGFNVVDLICRLARERTQYEHHVDNLPEGASLIPGAWKDDPFAKAVAKELWSRVVVFNFGKPGWFERYRSWSDEEKGSFIESGYIPRFPTT